MLKLGSRLEITNWFVLTPILIYAKKAYFYASYIHNTIQIITEILFAGNNGTFFFLSCCQNIACCKF